MATTTMTFKDLDEIVKENGFSTPVVYKNDEMENVILESGCDESGKFYKTVTAQHNGWTRVNVYYEEGTITEIYKK